jgi:hypothetical protein
MKPLAGVGNRAGDATPKSNLGSNIGGGYGLGLNQNSLLNPPRDEKEAFFQKKKREEIERLELEITNERLKLSKQESEHLKRLDDLRDKHKKDLSAIETSQKLTLDLLLSEKEKTLEAHQEAIARERLKMEVHHSAELESKQRQH